LNLLAVLLFSAAIEFGAAFMGLAKTGVARTGQRPLNDLGNR